MRSEREKFQKQIDLLREQLSSTSNLKTEVHTPRAHNKGEKEEDLQHISTGSSCMNSFLNYINNFSGNMSLGDQHFLLGRFARQLIYYYDLQPPEGKNAKDLFPPLRFMKYFLSKAQVQNKIPLVKMVGGQSCMSLHLT